MATILIIESLKRSVAAVTIDVEARARRGGGGQPVNKSPNPPPPPLHYVHHDGAGHPVQALSDHHPHEGVAPRRPAALGPEPPAHSARKDGEA